PAAIVWSGGSGRTMKKQSREDSVDSPQIITFDAIMPPVMAVRAEASGVTRASMGLTTFLALSLWAGAFVSFGAIFATTLSAGSAELPYGVARLLFGLVFTAGLIIGAIVRAEVFFGNNIRV